MGGKGGKRKGAGLVVPGFGAGGFRSPSPTLSALGSVAGAAEPELSFGISYDVPVKVPRVGVTESVADVAALSTEVERLDVHYCGGALGRLREGIRNLRVVPEVRSGLMFETECLLRRFDVLVRAEKERDEMLRTHDTLMEGFKAASVVASKVRLELESARAELELSRGDLSGVRGELESVKGEREVVVAERDEARKVSAHRLMRLDRFQEGTKIVNKEMERLLQEGFDLRAEIERLKSGKILKGKDKGMRMPVMPPPPEVVEVGIQAEVPEVSTVSLQTDVSRVQVVRETTYAFVAAQTCSEAVPVAMGVDIEMGGVGGGPSGPPPVPGMPIVPVVPVPGVVRAQALLIHGVDCRRGMGALFAAASRLSVGECTVRGVRWLLGVGRRWGKRLSSVVVYLDHPFVVRGNSVWFGGAPHPVERNVFAR